MLQRSVEVEVDCSVQQVYDFWEDLENVPRWMPLGLLLNLISFQWMR